LFKNNKKPSRKLPATAFERSVCGVDAVFRVSPTQEGDLIRTALLKPASIAQAGGNDRNLESAV
jgi:hypothetical protein